MVENKDIRWKQRFSNYKKALNKLSEAINYVQRDLNEKQNYDCKNENIANDIIREGLIQRFEYTHELAWNVMKDFLLEVSEIKTFGSKDATRAAFSAELIENGNVWMQMINSRNKTSHTYNEETADEIYYKILNEYYPAFVMFKDLMEQKQQ